MVRGDHRAYLIAVMTNENPDEGYGIDTIEGISRIGLGGPAPKAGARRQYGPERCERPRRCDRRDRRNGGAG